MIYSELAFVNRDLDPKYIEIPKILISAYCLSVFRGKANIQIIKAESFQNKTQSIIIRKQTISL